MKKITSGVYQIENKINNKVYVGSSINVYTRWNHHKRDLNLGNHHNIHLQRAWNKYGESNFEFSILEDTVGDKETLLNREQFYMDLTKCYNENYGYNINLKSESSLGLKRNPLTEEHKLKISLGNKGKFVSDETKKKLSISKRGRSLKLTENQVKEIKLLIRDTDLLLLEIGEIYGVSGSIIGSIKSGHSWGYVAITDTDKISDNLKTLANLKIRERKIRPNRKLKNDNVIEIKLLLANGIMTNDEIAKIFNVEGSVISNIKTGKTWSHIGQDIVIEKKIKTDEEFVKEVMMHSKDGITVPTKKLLTDNGVYFYYTEIKKRFGGNKNMAERFNLKRKVNQN